MEKVLTSPKLVDHIAAGHEIRCEYSIPYMHSTHMDEYGTLIIEGSGNMLDADDNNKYHCWTCSMFQLDDEGVEVDYY